MKRKTDNVSNTSQPYSRFPIFVAFLAYLLTHLLLQSCGISEGTPTVEPYDKFDLEKDVDSIQKAGDKLGKRVPDSDKMVRMVCHRSRDQRLQMKAKFYEKYNKQDIAKFCGGAVDGELSLGDLLVDCFQTVMEIYRNHLNWELTYKFKRTDKNSIVELLLSIPPEEKEKFLKDYNDAFKITVEQEIDNEILDPELCPFFKTMVNKNRKPDIPPDKVNWELAKKEATLLNDGRKGWEKHTDELDRILLETPIQQLNATFIEFKKINGKEIDEVMKKKLSKDLKGCYRAIVFFVKNKHDYYARRLEKAMEGWGTQDHVLNRIISIHCEDDLKEIAIRFQLNTAESLIHDIEKETTIHHEMLLTCLAGKQTVKEEC